MEKGKLGIDTLIEIIVRAKPLFSKTKLYIHLMKDSNYILSNFRKSYVAEDQLLSLLKKSIHNNLIKQLIPDILYLTETESITDAVVQFCIQYPDDFRETLLNQLAHLWLTVRQLETLHKYASMPETFCKLYVLYADDECCSAEKFSQFLETNRRYIADIDCMELLSNYCVNVTADKTLIARRYNL